MSSTRRPRSARRLGVLVAAGVLAAAAAGTGIAFAITPDDNPASGLDDTAVVLTSTPTATSTATDDNPSASDLAAATTSSATSSKSATASVDDKGGLRPASASDDSADHADGHVRHSGTDDAVPHATRSSSTASSSTDDSQHRNRGADDSTSGTDDHGGHGQNEAGDDKGGDR